MNFHPRLAREFKTVVAMVQIYCRDHHAPGPGAAICSACENLIDYASKRLDKCPFQQQKPTCGKCTIHCYRLDMRSKVREVMRYSGPKMIRHHPVLAAFHLLDTMRKPKDLPSPVRKAKRPAAKDNR